MKLIKPSYKIIEQQSKEIGMLKHIETCGRVAWKSEDKITDNSYIKFVEMLKGVNHGSVLEHGTVYLAFSFGSPYEDKNYIIHSKLFRKYLNNKYSKVIDFEYDSVRYAYITTNYRVLVENNWLEDLKYQCDPTEYHEKRVTVRFVCDIGVSREFNRHRTFSITEQSTRYCNFSKEKFNSELTFIIPCWINLEEDTYKNIKGSEDSYDIFKSSTKTIKGLDAISVEEDSIYRYLSLLSKSEYEYFGLLNNNWKPQQARNVLPLSLKTEVIYTGFVSDWKHFFKLRTASSAHPQTRELAIPLEEEFKKLNLI